LRTPLDQGEVTNAKGRQSEVKEFCLGRRKNGTTTEAAEHVWFFVEDSAVSLYSNYEMDIF